MTRRSMISLAATGVALGQSRIRMPLLGQAFDVRLGALVKIYGQPGSLVMAPIADAVPRRPKGFAAGGGEYVLLQDEAGAISRCTADHAAAPLADVPLSPASVAISDGGGAAVFGYPNEILAMTMGKEPRISLRVPLLNARVLAVREDGRQALASTGNELWLTGDLMQPVSLGEAPSHAVAGFADDGIVLADQTLRVWNAKTGRWTDLAPTRDPVAVTSPDGKTQLVADADGVLAVHPSGQRRYSSFVPPTQLLGLSGGCYLVTGFDSEFVLVFAPGRGVVSVIRMEVAA